MTKTVLTTALALGLGFPQHPQLRWQLHRQWPRHYGQLASSDVVELEDDLTKTNVSQTSAGVTARQAQRLNHQ